MRFVWWLIVSVSIISCLGIVSLLLLRYLNRSWWQLKPVRWISYLLTALGGLGLVVWFLAFLKQIIWLAGLGATLSVTVFITFLALTLTLPFSGIIHKINSLFEKRLRSKREAESRELRNTRRLFLKGVAAAIPLAAVATGGSGVVRAFQRADVYRLPIQLDYLPPELEGLKILHLSDSHLGIYKFLDDLEEILSDAEKMKPDIVLFTGDIADDLALLPEALKMTASLKPEYGTYASLGNHEYYRGINQVQRIFDRGPVRLLRSSGIAIDIKGVSLYLAGADDPRFLGRDNTAFLQETTGKALDGAPSDAFNILMSHRPEGLNAAAEFGIDLTLSGHTHGGQVGINGRSFWEGLVTDRYLWGEYNKRRSRMYLTSGIGHWFPFRLGCPPEAPVIELGCGNNV